ncbi:hypothetical protein V8G54_001947 [Vigna mungo]|uniref:Uncharacterized protein n=1 Tax=Vigna mungo TaxID=3915 RepID=A0AAQ3SBE3_VIGMU
MDAPTLVIQHPYGKIERLYWPVSARKNQDQKPVLFTRVKLLRPNETLTLGHAYRLDTTQEVVKALKAKKHAKMKKPHGKTVDIMQIMQLEKASSDGETGGMLDTGNIYQGMKADRYRLMNSTHAALKLKSWRPSLQSISESSS